jgi:hypothetical protein
MLTNFAVLFDRPDVDIQDHPSCLHALTSVQSHNIVMTNHFLVQLGMHRGCAATWLTMCACAGCCGLLVCWLKQSCCMPCRNCPLELKRGTTILFVADPGKWSYCATNKLSRLDAFSPCST